MGPFTTAVAIDMAKNALGALLANWRLVLILVLVAAIPVHGCQQYRQGFENGAESVKAELRAAQAKASEKALKAAARADARGLEREEKNAKVIGSLLNQIEEAESDGRNPLDALIASDHD